MGYAEEAAGIYDPQLNSEKVVLETNKNNNLMFLGEEEGKINPLYEKAVGNLRQTRNEEGARADFSYSDALWGQKTGLLANEQGRLGKQLESGIKETDTARAEAFQKIANRKKSYLDDFSAGLQSLVSKYAGLKNQYVVGKQAEDRDRAWQAAEAAKARAAQIAASRSYGGGGGGGYGAAAGGANRRSQLDSELRNYEQALRHAPKGSKPMTYEQAVKTFADQYKGSGISSKEIGARLYSIYGKRYNMAGTKKL